MGGSFLWNQRGLIEAPWSVLLCLLYLREWCKIKEKAAVVNENVNNLMLAKDLLDDVNSVKHFIVS